MSNGTRTAMAAWYNDSVYSAYKNMFVYTGDWNFYSWVYVVLYLAHTYTKNIQSKCNDAVIFAHTVWFLTLSSLLKCTKQSMLMCVGYSKWELLYWFTCTTLHVFCLMIFVNVDVCLGWVVADTVDVLHPWGPD